MALTPFWRGEVYVGGWPFSHDEFQTFHDFLIKTTPCSFMGDHFPCIYPSFRPFIRSNIVLFFIYFFFHLFDTVLTYFLLKNFKRWAHHWISLPVYINNQKPRWNFFFLNRLRKRNETFGRLWSQCKNFTAKKHSHRRKGVEGWGGRSPGRKINQCSRF